MVILRIYWLYYSQCCGADPPIPRNFRLEAFLKAWILPCSRLQVCVILSAKDSPECPLPNRLYRLPVGETPSFDEA